MALGTPAELAASRAKLIAQGKAGVKDASEMIKYLRLVRELSVHDAEGVVEHGSYVLARAKGQLAADECAA